MKSIKRIDAQINKILDQIEIDRNDNLYSNLLLINILINGKQKEILV